MDPFSRNENFSQQQEDRDQIFDIPTQLHGIIGEEELPKLQAKIEKTTGTLEKSFKLILFAAAMAAVFSLLFPFSRLLYEFSKWAFCKIGSIFP